MCHIASDQPQGRIDITIKKRQVC